MSATIEPLRGEGDQVSTEQERPMCRGGWINDEHKRTCPAPHADQRAAGVPVSAGDEIIRPGGEIFRFEPCDGGLVLKPTGQRYDVRAALRDLQRLGAPGEEEPDAAT